MIRLDIKAAVTVDDAGSLTGIAWPFGAADRVGDMIEPAAFKSVGVPMPMLFGHDQNDPVGAWTEAKVEQDGLHLKGRLLIEDLPRAREVRALVSAGAVRGISIGFITRKAVPRQGGGRTISALELLEASLVAVPMHAGARVISAKTAVSALSIANALNRATAYFGQR
jgi:HK97 family phage prohead protease